VTLSDVLVRLLRAFFADRAGFIDRRTLRCGLDDQRVSIGPVMAFAAEQPPAHFLGLNDLAVAVVLIS